VGRVTPTLHKKGDELMLNLTIAVPVPLALFIIVLALAIIGFVRTEKTDTDTRMAWVTIGFCEVMLALICFVGIDALFHNNLTIVWFVVPITFSFVSLCAIFGSSFLFVKGKL
jgi:hypothetical protein